MRPLAYRLAALAVAAFIAFPFVGSATSSLNPPSGTITSITPASGPTAGGTTITILGTDLYYGTSGPAVTIGGASAPVTSWRRWGAFGETEIIATTPPGAAGAADVRVVTADPNYNDRLLALSPGGFTYVAPAPTITATAVSPTSGLTTGGEVVTITGTGFSRDRALIVYFTDADGTTRPGPVTVASETSLTVGTPGGAKGKASISVKQGGATAVLESAYTYNQGYWLTVETDGPSDIGTLGSLGAVRTPSFGDWATARSPFTSYSGGINCGDRTKVDGLVTPASTISWAGGPCRYAFPEDTSVKLAALSTGSLTFDAKPRQGSERFTVGGRPMDSAPYSVTEYGFVRRWLDACLGVTGSNCTVKMTGDRVVGAAWGYFMFVNSPLFPGGVTTVRDGELYLSLLAAEKPVGQDTTYFVGVGFSTESGTENGARARPQQVVACRAKARLSGRRLTARCAPNQALTRALRKGSVRMTTRWYVRLPNQRAARLIATRTQMVRSPRAGAVTG